MVVPGSRREVVAGVELSLVSALGDDARLELVPDAVLIVDSDGRIVYANLNCQELMGWSPEELRGERVERLVPERYGSHAALRHQFMAAPSRRPMGAGLELYVRHRSGEEIPVDIALNPVSIEGVTHVVVAMRGMRAYREALQKLGLLSVAVDAAASGVVITDQDGIITWANPAACRMTGYGPDELIGKRPSLLKSGCHDQAFYEALWSTVRSGAIWRGSIINRKKDGSMYHEEQTIAPVEDRNGVISHFIAVKQDVTERVLAETLLRETRDELARRVTEVETLHVQLLEQAVRDSLSGLFNRRYLDETLPRELAKARRDRAKVTLAVLDIDHFKAVNDTHGHAVGDRVIAELGGILRGQSRVCDVACRYGGEEFAVVMLSAGLEDGLACADGWRRSFGAVSVPAGSTVARATLSAGVAEAAPGETPEALFARADAALYRAKHAGRNRVLGAPPPV